MGIEDFSGLLLKRLELAVLLTWAAESDAGRPLSLAKSVGEGKPTLVAFNTFLMPSRTGWIGVIYAQGASGRLAMISPQTYLSKITKAPELPGTKIFLLASQGDERVDARSLTQYVVQCD